ncbi:MAG TPA: tRNA guanosine(34) transglycosylase Tgt [Alphaproteobacteria bacterium]|nr:tRNA guanosine(34) transglycosylase Tgt [Alphaproteobacteria bacterium]
MSGLGFELLARDGVARRGRLTTAHGTVNTPAFMPVGTQATVKGMTWQAVLDAGAEIVLGNTYHLMLRPGAETVERLGGLHKFSGWRGPILTDSGGYQVMSLAALRKISEDGVAFRSHIDGTRHLLTPERSIEIQHKLDSDITMVLDECVALPAPVEEANQAMELSLRWAERSKAAFTPRPGYGLFGIVQGGTDETLRKRSAEGLVALGFDGYAVGGLAVGEGQELMLATLDLTVPHLPEDRPRYLMGVGTPSDLVQAVARGIDLFDCVMPTRSGRTAKAFTRFGEVNLRNARHANDPRPLEEGCPCPACSGPTAGAGRAYLHHLFKADEMLGPMLLTWHNVRFYLTLMKDIREAIAGGTYATFAARALAELAGGDIPPL